MLNYIKNSPEVIMYKSFSLRCMISFLVCVGVACVEAKCPVPGTIPDVNKIKIPVIERHSPVKSKELKLTVDGGNIRSEEHTSELQSLTTLVCRLLLEKKQRYSGQAHPRTERRMRRGSQR